jgi:hypothetical protein
MDLASLGNTTKNKKGYCDPRIYKRNNNIIKTTRYSPTHIKRSYSAITQQTPIYQ